MIGKHLARSLGALFLASLLPSGGSAQQRFRTTTELVQVDVVVLDQAGRPVKGLQADEFTILDRGKPREVQAFSEITHEASASTESHLPVDVRSDVADNAAARSRRAIVLVVHDMVLARSRMNASWEILRQFITQLGSEASIALLFTSGRSSVEFTHDPAELLEAVKRMSGRLDRMPPSPEAFDRLLKTMEDAARHLRFDQTRRKAMILVAPGIGADVSGLFDHMRTRPGKDPIHDKKGDARQQMNDAILLAMMESLRRSNVTLYAIDPRGSMASALARFREEPEAEGTPLRMLDPIYQAQEGLRLTAEAAGGFAVVETHELQGGLARIVTDLDNYYLLGFYPENLKDESWHDLSVVVNRPGVIVRHRKGYRLGGKPPKPKNKDPMVVLSEGVLPATGLGLRLFATPIALSTKSTTVAAALEIRDPALTSPTGADDHIKVTLLAVDLRKKKVVRRIDRAASLRLGADAELSYQFPFSLILPPGSYQLRASASSAGSGKSGSVYMSLEVPTPPRAAIAIAGLALSLASDAPTTGDLLPSPLVLDREFAATEILRASYWFAMPTGAKLAASVVEVLDRTRTAVWRDEPRLSSAARIDVTVPLSGLTAGSYRLRVSIVSDPPSVREIGFAVK